MRSLFASNKFYLWLTWVRTRNLLEGVWSSLQKEKEPTSPWGAGGRSKDDRLMTCCQEGSTPAIFRPWVMGSEFKFRKARVWLGKMSSCVHMQNKQKHQKWKGTRKFSCFCFTSLLFKQNIRYLNTHVVWIVLVRRQSRCSGASWNQSPKDPDLCPAGAFPVCLEGRGRVRSASDSTVLTSVPNCPDALEIKICWTTYFSMKREDDFNY